MNIKRYVITALVALTLISSVAMPASAATITVGEESTNDYHSIENAVSNATTGDTIVIAPGTYYENVSTQKDLTFQNPSGETDDVYIVAYNASGDSVDAIAGDTVNMTIGDNITMVNKSTVYVNPRDAFGNYSTVENAVDNASMGTVIEYEPGTYVLDSTVNVSTDFIKFESNTAGENVTIDGSDTPTGDAINVKDGVMGFHTSEDVEILDGALGGGGSIGNFNNVSLTSEFMGFPVIVWLGLVGVVGYYVVKEE